MLDTFQYQNNRDFKQRYSGSYGYYQDKETGKRILVLMQDVGDDTAAFVDAKQNAYRVAADSGVQFEFLPARKKLFIHKEKLYYIRRKPARMWARGINLQNTELSEIGGGNVGLTFPKIVSALEPHADVLQSVKRLENRELSCVAISNLFGVSEGILWLYDKEVADFLADRKEILVREPLFEQEIKDMVAKTNLQYKVFAA